MSATTGNVFHYLAITAALNEEAKARAGAPAEAQTPPLRPYMCRECRKLWEDNKQPLACDQCGSTDVDEEHIIMTRIREYDDGRAAERDGSPTGRGSALNADQVPVRSRPVAPIPGDEAYPTLAKTLGDLARAKGERASAPPPMPAEMQAVIDAAVAYRAQEHADTPRMFRGKDLHELGLALDAALERLSAARAETGTDKGGA